MIELVDLSTWKKQDVILTELHRDWAINISSRKWRTEVEKWNERFSRGEVKYYIAHSSKGFKKTNNYEDAKLSRDDYMKRAFDMLKKARSVDKAFGNLKNYKIDFEKGELI